MSKNIREKATALLDAASTREAKAFPCAACGMMQALPESSAHLVTRSAR